MEITERIEHAKVLFGLSGFGDNLFCDLVTLHLESIVENHTLKCSQKEQEKGMTLHEWETLIYGAASHSWEDEKYFLEWDEADTLRESFTNELNEWKRKNSN